jgi:hypothetical protein
MKSIENSEGEQMFLCANVESGAYLEETDICGGCNLEDEQD